MDTTVRATLRHAIQALALATAFVLSFAIRFEGAIPPERVTQMVVVLPVVVIAQVIALGLAGVGRQSWRYTTLGDLVEMVVALTGVAGLLVVGRVTLSGGAELPWGVFGLPASVIFADWALAILVLAALRAVRRLQSEGREARHAERRATHVDVRRVVLIGAGRAGVLTAREMERRPDVGMEPVAFLDDDRGKRGLRVAGLRVVGTTDDIARVVDEYDVAAAVVTISGLQRKQLQRIVEACARAGIDTKIVPGVYEIMGGDVQVSRIRSVDMADLLGRPTVELDDEATQNLVNGACVMVTGAGGSIGSELVRQLAGLVPARMVLLDQSEPALWAIHREITRAHPGLDTEAVIGDVCDTARMRRVFDQLRPAVVVHAAAHKHVPMMEFNPGEAVKNNLGGTRSVLDLSVEFDVARFVMVSTDKAVNPTSVMGATKRLAERYVQHVARTSGIHAVSVRFGNVLGSQGSVVPIFREQIEQGGPVLVTHRDMMRYFMTIPEAAQLILQSMVVSDPGEVLVLDMGEPVRILDLAKTLIRLSGFVPGSDIAIEFTGRRPGEKLFEELSLDDEHATQTRYAKIWIGAVDDPNWPTVHADVDELLSLVDELSAHEVRDRVRVLVPEFVAPDPDADTDTAPANLETAPADVGAAPADGSDITPVEPDPTSHGVTATSSHPVGRGPSGDPNGRSPSGGHDHGSVAAPSDGRSAGLRPAGDR